jgi:voltage-gated potassium channel
MILRLRIAGLLGRVYNAVADLHWSVLAGLVLLHAMAAWLLLALAGEKTLTEGANFVYWYATTAYTVGYGDLSPQTTLGRLETAFFIYPGAIAALTTVVAKGVGGVGEVWRQRREGKGDYRRMADSIVLVGFDDRRTPRVIEELCADMEPDCALVLVTRRDLTAPDPRVRYVRAQALTRREDLLRAGVPTAARVVVYGENDDETLAAALAVAGLTQTAHVVCFFQEDQHALLLRQHFPKVECVVAPGPQQVVMSVQNPGASLVLGALTSHLDEGATLYSLVWPAGAAATYRDAAMTLLERQATLLALQPPDAPQPLFNLHPDAAISPGDRLFYVADARLKPSQIRAGV